MKKLKLTLAAAAIAGFAALPMSSAQAWGWGPGWGDGWGNDWGPFSGDGFGDGCVHDHCRGEARDGAAAPRAAGVR